MYSSLLFSLTLTHVKEVIKGSSTGTYSPSLPLLSNFAIASTPFAFASRYSGRMIDFVDFKTVSVAHVANDLSCSASGVVDSFEFSE